MSKYTTVMGDTWDLISYKSYGSEKYSSELMDVNSEHIDTVIFSAGVVLKLPDISSVYLSSNLPPWK